MNNLNNIRDEVMEDIQLKHYLNRVIRRDIEAQNLSDSKGRENFELGKRALSIVQGTRPRKEMDYRVVESASENGSNFSIQILIQENCERSFVDWLMRRPHVIEIKWVSVDTHGRPWKRYMCFPPPPLCPTFTTLAAARKMIKVFKTPDKFHY